MGTVSKKRGRPSKFSDEERIVAALSNSTTTRGKQNFMYGLRAHHMLGDKDLDASPFGHFLPSYNEVTSGRKEFSSVLLSEIGRLAWDEMRPVAQEICDRKLTTKEAIAFVRRNRLGDREKEFNQYELFGKIAKCVNAYTDSHFCTNGQLLATLQSISEIISEKVGK